MDTPTPDSTVAAQPTKQTAAPAKSATITLRANGAVLTLMATCKSDGTAVSTVTTKDAEKKKTRGMTETHKTFEAAKAHLNTLAQKAQKIGWERKTFKVTAKPDAFKELPKAPKLPATTKGAAASEA